MTKFASLGVLANLPMAGKLSLGFGLVLLATFGVAASALDALKSLQERALQLESATSNQLSVLQVRVAEKTFALTRAPETVKQVRDGIEMLSQGVPADIETEALNGYLKQFERYQQAMEESRRALVEMRVKARDAADGFAALLLDQLDALNDAKYPDQAIEKLVMLGDAQALNDRLAMVRDSEQSFVLDGAQRYRDDWELSMNYVQASVDSLAKRFAGSDLDSLARAGSALASYRSAFKAYTDAKMLEKTSAEAMDQEANGVLSALSASSQRQRRAIQAEGEEAYRQLFLIVFLALAIGAIASLLIRYVVVGELRRTVALVRRVAEGDLTGEVVVSRCDEIGELAAAMKTMLSSLRLLFSDIGLGVACLADVSGVLVDVVERATLGLEHQRTEIEQTATAMQEMATSARDVARSASYASGAASSVNRAAQQGEELVRQTRLKMAELNTEMAGTTQAMTSLIAEGEAINRILEVINSVAEQTNLLALNAAIEAARAGEHGRGFAVVAEEVRALASRTRHSTCEVHNLVQRYQQVASEAAEHMQDSCELIEEGAELAQQASAALAEITSAVSNIKLMSRQIADASGQQSSLTEEVGLSMQRLRKVATESTHLHTELQQASCQLCRVSDQIEHAVTIFRR